jgi:hypothetical protein
MTRKQNGTATEERRSFQDVVKLSIEIVSHSVTQSRVAVAGPREQFGNPEEGRLLLLEAVARRLVKTQQAEKANEL